MKKLYILALTLLLSAPVFGQFITRLIGASPFQDSLWVFDTTSFEAVRRLAPTPSSGGSITGMVGIAKDPTSGTIYVVTKQTATTGRTLGTLNPLTGVITILGNLGDQFSSITFNSNGTLFGVTGDGATVPETFYKIDKTTAAVTMVATLGNGADGEIISFNPADNKIYHWSGNTTIVFESFDTTGANVTNIPITGSANGEIFGAVYRGGGVFLTSSINARFQTFTTAGVQSADFGATSPDDIRGTVYITCSRAIMGINEFCAGDSTMLMAPVGGTSYQWYLNGSAIAGATNAMYFASQQGHYNFIISDACGTDSLGTGMFVTENALPVVTITGNTTYCAGDSTELTGSSGGTSQWYMNGIAISGATSNTFYATTPGVYNMIKTNLNGCSDSAATGISVNENPLPVVSITGTSDFCAGDSGLLSSSAGVSYQWFQDGMPVSGGINNTFYASDSGNYNVIVTDMNGCSDSASAGMMVIENPLPVVLVTGTSQFCAGDSAGLFSSLGASFQWFMDGMPIGGATASTYYASVAGIYNVIVTDTNGCSDSASAGMMVTENPLPLVDLGPDLTACDSAIVDAGNPGSSYLWCDASTTQTVVINSTGSCYVVVTDVNGCRSSDTITVTINASPVVGLTSTVDSTCINGPSLTLTGTPAGGTYSGSGVTGNVFDPTVAGLGAHIVSYFFTDSTGCAGMDTMTITVNVCVGTNSPVSLDAASLFPNPTAGNLHITLSASSTVSFYNAIGEIVLCKQLAKGMHILDLSSLPDGVYFARVESGENVSVQRVVMQR